MSCCSEVRGSDNHCGQCYETFATMALFDGHQDVDYHRTPPVVCRAPQSLGAVQGPGGTWHTPEGLKARQGSAARLARARSAKEPQR